MLEEADTQWERKKEELEGRMKRMVAVTDWIHNHSGSKHQCRAQDREELQQKGFLDPECWWYYSHKQTAHWYGNCWRLAHNVAAVAEAAAAVVATVVGLCRSHLKEGGTRHMACRMSTVGDQEEVAVDPDRDNHMGIQT